MHYYGFNHTYGINTTDSYGNPIGKLYVFDTKQERDEWVSEDVWDVNYHRSAIGSKDARKYLENMWYDFGLFDKEEVRYMNIGNLVKLYRNWIKEYSL